MRPTVLVATSGLLAVSLGGSAIAQNLLTNADFSFGLAGWGVTATVDPGSEASVTLVPEDAGGGDVPAAVKFHLRMGPPDLEGWLMLGQCRAIEDDRPLAFGARVRVDRQVRANLFVSAAFYQNTQCLGSRFGTTSVNVLPSSGGTPLSSNGRWLFVSGIAEPPPGVRAVGFAIQVDEFVPTSAVEFEGLIDDAYVTPAGAQNNLWIVPSAARTPGLGGSFWTSNVSVANSSSVDGLATLKFLGNGVDGRAGVEQTVHLPTGHFVELRDVLGSVFAGRLDFGALRILATPGISVVSETSTPSSGGTVGLALPAFGSADLAGATPRTLAPIRENAAFRTNLVLANATEAPLTAHVDLFAADGTLLGTRDVDLPPLGMTQINGVASALGASTLDLGRIAVSTPTPGGLVATYASVIDNVTNDPRTLLPQDATDGTSAQNLLVNPGFDRDLSGWDVRTYFNYTGGTPGASATWDATDALSGNSGSVRFQLRGFAGTVNRVLLSQCVAATPGHRYTGGGMIRTDEQLLRGVITRLELFTSVGCAGDPVAPAPADGYSLLPMLYTKNDSQGRWLPASASVVAGPGVQSLRFSAGLDAVTYMFLYTSSSFDGLFDNAYLVEQTDPVATWILPSSAKLSGAAGSSWTTALAFANAGASDALVTLKFLGHGVDGRGGDEKSALVRAGTTVVFPDVLGSVFGRTQDYGAIRITSSSAGIAVESETSTPSSGGTVGQALPALGPADFAGATPRTLAPIRENAAFRTNLVLANATEAPLTAHVELFAADGTLLGARDVDLRPLGMTQINRVAFDLGTTILDAGRLAVSTPTSGGLVAAYASVIDNVTNDPRTLLPR